MKSILTPSAAALAVVTAPAAVGAVYSIQPQNEAESKDTKVYASVATSNFSSNLNVVSADITDFRALVQFDLTALAAVAADDIASASVRLYVTGLNLNAQSTSASAQVNLRPITGAWRENAADPGAAPLATWDALFGATPTLAVGAVAASQTVSAVGYYDWDVTALVKAWKNGTQPNDGLLIEAPGPLGDVGIADTDVPSQGPALIVTTVPEPASGLFGLLACGLLSVRRQRRGA